MRKNQTGEIVGSLLLLGMAVMLAFPIISSLAIKKSSRVTTSAIFPHEISISEVSQTYDSGSNTFTIKGKLCFNANLSSGSEQFKLWATNNNIVGGTSSLATGSHAASLGEYLCIANRHFEFTLNAPMTSSWQNANCPETTFILGMSTNRRGRLDNAFSLPIARPASCKQTAITPTIPATISPTLVPLACPWPKPGESANHPPDCPYFASLPSDIKDLVRPSFPSDDRFEVRRDFRFHFPWQKPAILDLLTKLPDDIRRQLPTDRPLLREYRWTIYAKTPSGEIINCYADERGFGKLASNTSTGVDSSVEGPLPERCRIPGAEWQGSVRAIYNISTARIEDGKYFNCCRLDELKTSWIKLAISLTPTTPILPSATSAPTPTRVVASLTPLPSPTSTMVASPTSAQCQATSLPNFGNTAQSPPSEVQIRQFWADGRLVCRRVSGTEMEITNYRRTVVNKINANFYRCACPGTNSGEVKCSTQMLENSCSYRKDTGIWQAPGDQPELQPGGRIRVRFAPASACEISEFNFVAYDSNDQPIPCFTPDGRSWDGGVAFMIDNRCSQGASLACVVDKAPDVEGLPAVPVPASSSGSGPYVFLVDLTCDGKVTARDISVAITSYAQNIDACGQSVYMDAKAFSAMLREFSNEGE